MGLNCQPMRSGSDLFQEWLESELVENYIPNSMAKVFAERPDVESDPQTWLRVVGGSRFSFQPDGGERVRRIVLHDK